jgi:hypothetical protein
MLPARAGAVELVASPCPAKPTLTSIRRTNVICLMLFTPLTASYALSPVRPSLGGAGPQASASRSGYPTTWPWQPQQILRHSGGAGEGSPAATSASLAASAASQGIETPGARARRARAMLGAARHGSEPDASTDKQDVWSRGAVHTLPIHDVPPTFKSAESPRVPATGRRHSRDLIWRQEGIQDGDVRSRLPLEETHARLASFRARIENDSGTLPSSPPNIHQSSSVLTMPGNAL